LPGLGVTALIADNIVARLSAARNTAHRCHKPIA
jgi:hypothetical protein